MCLHTVCICTHAHTLSAGVPPLCDFVCLQLLHCACVFSSSLFVLLLVVCIWVCVSTRPYVLVCVFVVYIHCTFSRWNSSTLQCADAKCYSLLIKLFSLSISLFLFQSPSYWPFGNIPLLKAHVEHHSSFFHDLHVCHHNLITNSHKFLFSTTNWRPQGKLFPG